MLPTKATWRRWPARRFALAGKRAANSRSRTRARSTLRFSDEHPLPGSTGEADNATEGYCFRFHVTKSPNNRVPIEKPAGYRREDYAWQLEDIRAGKITRFEHIIQMVPLPGDKFELNSDHPHPDTGVPSESLDLAEDNFDWPTAAPSRRREIYDRYLTHNVGLIWLLQNDEGMPKSLRDDARQWGWCRDEWPAHGHVPYEVYVRQGRRIEGDAMLTERDGDLDPKLSRTRIQPTSIGVVEWAFDPHGCHKFDPQHPGVREGYGFIKHPPFQIPYGVIVPRKIDGLLSPVACSCSHVAYNALRMEPVFMALGEAAGLAAKLAIDEGRTVRSVPVAKLQRLLVKQGGVITFYEDLPFDHPQFAALQWLGAHGASAWTTRRLRRKSSHAAKAGSNWRESWDFKASRGVRRVTNPTPRSPAAPLSEWLTAAGEKPRPPIAADGQQLDMAEFAAIVYGALDE